MHPNSPVFEFLHHLVQRAGVKRILCVGDNAAKNLVSIVPDVEIVQFSPSADSLEWLRSGADEYPVKQVRFIETGLEQPFVIDQALLEDAIVVCLDVLDQLQNPKPLITTLAIARQHCKFMLITVADRVRTAGFTFRESPENAHSHQKSSAEEFFQALVKAGFPQSMLFGFTSNTPGVGPKNSILVVAGLEAEPTVVPGDFRVAAIINVFNEIDIIETIVRYLADQGIEVHLVDNWSDDGSFELCQHLLKQKLIKNLLRFPVQKTNDYEWAKQLEHTAEYAVQLDANWVIHYDADEIRCSPWQNLNLFEAINFVDFLGYTAIDFTVMDFRFTDDNDVGNFSPDEFHFFEFGRHSAYFTQIKAWKNWHQLVDLSKHGGHEAVFAEQRVYPLKFLTKHFSLRSREQAAKKIFRERFPRITKERAERGWHVHFDQYKYLQSIEPWKPYELTVYDKTTFQYEFLVERLSGVGVWRENHTSLNRNTADNLGRVVEEMDGRLASLNHAIAGRDETLQAALSTIESLRRSASCKNFHPPAPTKKLLPLLSSYHLLAKSSLSRGLRHGFYNPPLALEEEPRVPTAIGTDRVERIELMLPTTKEPVVSVIVPVYGHIDYTLKCLHSIAYHPQTVPFEVIIVDDYSPDNTHDILARVGGIHVLCNETNQGFILSCNRAAKVAKGKYLYFLNNDTEVCAGWLDELVKTFTEFPETGLVGSKLIYPDGTLQEAGGIIWRDGSACNFGRGQDPDLPVYNYAREVDYCSGASIMIPKTIFDELGGFDEYYIPAYCEDSDLALKVRAKGLKVMYQPLSVVVHHESITSGTSIESGTKAYQLVNIPKLAERWRETLASHQSPGEDVDRAINPGSTHRALVVYRCTPTSDADTNFSAAINLMLQLRQARFQITFIPDDNSMLMPDYAPDLQRAGIEIFYRPYCTSLKQHLEKFGNRYDLVLEFRPEIADRFRQIASLDQTVAERDGQIASLKQAVTDPDGLIASLNQTVAKRDGQIASLNQTMAERDGQIASLNQTMADRDGQIANLNRAVAEQEARLGRAAIERDAANAKVRALLRSRSWRLTAPLRVLGTLARRISEPGPRCGLFSRVVMAVCVLPATFFHYRGLREWVAATTRGASFFGALLNNPMVSRERLASMPQLVRVPVSVGISTALRIRKNGGVLPSVRNMYRVFATEGMRGVYVRMMDHVPERDVVVKMPVNPHRILVADNRIPMQDVSAGERATVGILRNLCSLGYEVVFLPSNLAPSPKYDAELRALGVTVITSAQGYNSAVHYLSTQGCTFGAFYLIRIDVAEVLLDVVRQVAPTARVIFHAPDLCFLREMREAELQNNDTARTKANLARERELAIMRRVDHVVAVSPAEVSFLKEDLTNVPISVFPALYAPIATHPAPFEARSNIFFLGGFAHKPNVDAVQWFAKEIWPLVSVRLPGAEFHIIGAEMPQPVLDLAHVPGIKVVGFVPDLDPVLASMRVGVAPLRFGAGIKGKVAMTIGAGIPCVCTSIAAEGMGVQDGVHAYVTDDPQTFANAVVQLYNERAQWAQLSENGRELVRRHFGEEANLASLLHILNDANALPIQLFIDYCRTFSPQPVPCPGKNETVDVSVIIPVYNQWDQTRACITSILKVCAADDIHYEIILADNGSTDETGRAVEYYPGLHVFQTPKNLGFLRNCNNAAKHARGKHILLLSTNTVVLPGWMSALYWLMEKDESAAIVGSKLLYPDGTIQEAGSVLWNDGTTSKCGRYLSRNVPEYEYVREVDCISDSSFLIRKSFLDSVSSFDEPYEIAHCENLDLAMTARAKGMRVIYQPQSEIIHFEQKSCREENTDCPLSLQRENIQRLCDKWGNVLAHDHLPACTPILVGMANTERSPSPSSLAHRRQGRLNILYFSPFPSHPSNHGNQATIQQFGRRFQSLGHKVHFALLQSNIFSQDAVKDMCACWDTVDILPNSKLLWADGNPIAFDGWYEEGLGEQIHALCRKYDIDVVFCSYVFQSKLLEFVPAHILKVIDTHDRMGDRYKMLRSNGQPLEFFSCTPAEEGAYLRRADVVVARREEEARYFDSVIGYAKSITIPHFEEPRFVKKEFSGIRNVGIVASANRINLAIVRECLEAIDRRLHGKACPFTIHVAGQVKDMVPALPAREAAIFLKPWVQMCGFVPDIAKFYSGMDMILSPVTMGTGINVKTVQAMAYGMPLLTTPCGGKGIETGDLMHSHVDLDALADSLLSMTNRPEKLERLAALSRARYTTFYESSLAVIGRMFAHPKLSAGTDIPFTSATWTTIGKSDPTLRDRIYQYLYGYYELGERSNKDAPVRFDGSEATSYLPETLSRNQLHDDDFIIFRAFSDPKEVILDIGANWGYSVASIWSAGARARIISFEPIIAYQEGLQVIKDMYPNRYDFRMIGLANETAVGNFVVPVVNGTAISALTSASLPPYDTYLEDLAGNIHEYILRWMPDVETVSFGLFEFQAPVKKLDDILEEDAGLLGDSRLAAMKIDVEGYEGEVLKGSEATLRKYKPLILLEGGNRHEGLPSFMASLGYLYAERHGNLLQPVAGMGMAINGFFFHPDNIPAYLKAGILAQDKIKYRLIFE